MLKITEEQRAIINRLAIARNLYVIQYGRTPDLGTLVRIIENEDLKADTPEKQTAISEEQLRIINLKEEVSDLKNVVKELKTQSAAWETMSWVSTKTVMPDFSQS